MFKHQASALPDISNPQKDEIDRKQTIPKTIEHQTMKERTERRSSSVGWPYPAIKPMLARAVSGAINHRATEYAQGRLLNKHVIMYMNPCLSRVTIIIPLDLTTSYLNGAVEVRRSPKKIIRGLSVCKRNRRSAYTLIMRLHTLQTRNDKVVP